MSKSVLDPQYAGRPLTVRAGLSRPAWVTAPKKQDAILLRDASSSMQGDKSQEANAAAAGLVDALAAPENRGGFRVGVIDFSSDVRVASPLTAATDLAGRIPPLTPSGMTNLTGAIVEATTMIAAEKATTPVGETPLRPVVVILSDGVHNVGAPPHAAATALKVDADVVTVAFGSDADESLLTAIATSPGHFYRCRDGRELRRFFAAVGTTLSRSMARGTNAGAALASINP